MEAAGPVAVLILALLASTARSDDAGICGECHEAEAAQAISTGGHAPGLSCTACHDDRRPGEFGRHHRTVPRCATHHAAETAHPPRAHAKQARQNCLRCHDVHGSTNLHLVRSTIAVRAFRLRPVRFVNEEGAAPGGFTDPDAPGTGLCEVCHRRTDFFRADGRGKPHFTVRCVACHDHAAGFAPVISDANCTICHADEGARFAKPSLHSTEFACSGCHAEVSPDPGPGHRAITACADCHDSRTHAPPGEVAFPCSQCHDPHGTDNIKLVLDAITTPQGASRPIRFDNLLGRVDGSFASASAPGTGVCEVCHTTTRFYRADGTGAPHFEFSCLPCHLHANGFEPQ